MRERDRDAFPISDGKDTKPDAWSFSRPNDMEESQGGSPRKHPRGLSMFESDLLKERGTSKADSFAGDNSLSIRQVISIASWLQISMAYSIPEAFVFHILMVFYLLNV